MNEYMNFENTSLAAWLEDVVRHIMEKNVDGIAFVAQSNDGETFTAYYNCGCCRKMEFASHIQVDSMREVIEINRRDEDDEN